MTKLEKFEIAPVSNNLPLDDESLWVESRDPPYAEGEKVVYQKQIYESVSADNSANPTDSLRWVYVAPSNRWAWEDEFSTTYSVSSTDIVLEFENINDASVLVFSGVLGESIFIDIFEENELVSSENISLVEYREPMDIWEYYFRFGKSYQRTEYIYKINNFYFNARIKIRITPKEGESRLGFFRIGQLINVGCTQAQVQIYKNPLVELKRVQGKLLPIGGEGWKEKRFKLRFNRSIDLEQAIQDLDSGDGKFSVFIGDDTGERQEYSIMGAYNGYTLDVYTRTVEISIYAVDTY